VTAAPSPLALLALTTTAGAAAAQTPDSVESIYVMRSIRESRVPATEFCRESRTGFTKANSEDKYVFRSIAIRSFDSLVVDAAGAQVAARHACLGQTDDPAVMKFYMEGVIGSGKTLQNRAWRHGGASSISTTYGATSGSAHLQDRGHARNRWRYLPVAFRGFLPSQECRRAVRIIPIPSRDALTLP
jgi:hypothetical protein